MSSLAVHVFSVLIAQARLLLFLAAAVTGLALWQARELRLVVDLSGLIGPKSPAVEDLRQYAARFQPFALEEVLLISDGTVALASEMGFAAFEDLVLELQFVSGVASVISLWSLPGEGRLGSFLADPRLDALAPAERLASLRAADPLAKQLLAADLSATIVVVAAERGVDPAAFAQAVRAVTEQLGALRIDFIGLSEVQRAVASELLRDLRVLTPTAIVFCLILSVLLFRGWRAVVASVAPPVVGLVWFGGWLAAFQIPIDPVMGALPVVLIVLGFSDALHLWHAAVHRGGAHALAEAAAETAPAAILTSLTTMVAFASLWTARTPSLDRLALAGVVGVGLCLVAVLLLTPALLAVFRAPEPGARVPAVFALVVPAALVALRSRGTLVLAAALFILLLIGQSGSTPGFRYQDYLPKGATVTEALARADAAGLGSDRLILLVESEPVRASPSNAAAAVLAVWGEEVRAWLEGPAGAEMLARMAAPDGSAHALPVQLPLRVAGERADHPIKELEARLAEAGLADVARIIGPGKALVTEGPRVAEALRQGLYLTIAAVTVLIACVYRSVALAALSVIPNLIPILGVESWLALTGRELSIMNMIALTVAFGIAVDDTLHLLNRLRLAPPGAAEERLIAAVRVAGPPMAATTLVLSAGLVVTLWSKLPGLAVFGGLIAIAVALALLADLFLMPALVLAWSRWQTSGFCV